MRFTKTENIPADVDLTETLPKKGKSVDLSADPVIGGEGILPAINRLQEFAPAEFTVLQHDKGFILKMKREKNENKFSTHLQQICQP